MSLFSKLFGSLGESRSHPVLRAAEIRGAKTDVDKYYALLGSIQDSQTKRQFKRMLDCCAQSLPLLCSLVQQCKNEYGRFDLSSIPAIEVGCRYWAALNDTNSLRLVAENIARIPELQRGWRSVVESAFEDAKLSVKIRNFVTENPGALQNRMGKLLGASGKDTGRLINTLANLGIIVRIQSGKTYELHCGGRVS